MADLSTTTITIDDRIGSAYTTRGRTNDPAHDPARVDLTKPFRAHLSRPTVIVSRLPAADFSFPGNGPHGPCLVGVERKTVKDMLSSMRTGRFSGEQLPKLLDYYEYAYLVVEGAHRTNQQNGLLEEPWGGTWRPVQLGSKTTFRGLELNSFLNDVALRAPLKVTQTRDYPATVDYVLSLAYTFTKPWDRHSAHVAIHTPEPYAHIEKASTVRRVAYSLQGCGWVLSGEIERAFSTVESMVAATVKDWEKVDGIGRTLGKKFWKQLHGRDENAT